MNAKDLVDLDYLAMASRRSGCNPPTGELEVSVLDEGRTGAEVLRLVAGPESYVLKSIPRDSWRGPGMGRVESGEPLLWKSGISNRLPHGIVWPVLHVSEDHEDGYDWMLMRDVGDGIRGRGAFSQSDSTTLFRTMAKMHSRFYASDELARLPLPKASGTSSLFTKPLTGIGRGQESQEEWVEDFLEGFQVMPAFAPLFFECLGAKLADQFLALVADDGWKNALDALPQTLLHGDLRRANLAFSSCTLWLLDWELASLGPPGSDLQWHCFLHYWAYPPEGVPAGWDCAELLADYKAEMASSRPSMDPSHIDRGWKLGWVRAMCTIGYVLVDPLYPNGGSASERARVEEICQRGVQRALEYAEG
jgi:hypothetical protein